MMKTNMNTVSSMQMIMNENDNKRPFTATRVIKPGSSTVTAPRVVSCYWSLIKEKLHAPTMTMEGLNGKTFVYSYVISLRFHFQDQRDDQTVLLVNFYFGMHGTVGLQGEADVVARVRVNYLLQHVDGSPDEVAFASTCAADRVPELPLPPEVVPHHEQPGSRLVDQPVVHVLRRMPTISWNIIIIVRHDSEVDVTVTPDGGLQKHHAISDARRLVKRRHVPAHEVVGVHAAPGVAHGDDEREPERGHVEVDIRASSGLNTQANTINMSKNTITTIICVDCKRNLVVRSLQPVMNMKPTPKRSPDVNMVVFTECSLCLGGRIAANMSMSVERMEKKYMDLVTEIYMKISPNMQLSYSISPKPKMQDETKSFASMPWI
ncbi:hypothetical protein N7522_005148 [Penicillium canescens]|nr:hypothetical protein N7522_005148 [Penicillium canescens]